MPATNLIQRVFERAREMRLDEALPRLSGLDARRVAAIRASDPVSAVEYERLCLAVAVDPVVIYRGEETKPGRIPARFRAAVSLDRPAGEDLRLLALAAEQGRILGHLLMLLGRKVGIAAHRAIRGLSPGLETWREGYDLGEQARTAVFPEPGPIHDLPALLRELGVHVAHVAFSSADVDAGSVWDPSAVPVILVNKTSSRYQHKGALRATMAHELCHLLHDAGEQNLTTVVSWGIRGQGNYADGIEVRARAFAPAFLAPRDQTVAWSETLSRKNRNNDREFVGRLADHWGLSFEGAARHAKSCQLLSAERAESLSNQPSPRRREYGDFVTAPPCIPPAMVNESLPEFPTELWDGWAVDVVLDALEEEHITVGRARELLTWG